MPKYQIQLTMVVEDTEENAKWLEDNEGDAVEMLITSDSAKFTIDRVPDETPVS